MDRMNERVVKGKADGRTFLGLIAAVVLIMIGALAVVFIPSFGIFGGIVAVAGVYLFIYIKEGLNMEYEYTLTNGDIDVAKILSKSRRKEVLSIAVGDITYMDYADSDKVKNDLEVKKGKAKIHFYNGSAEDGKDVAVYSTSGNNEVISIFNFDEKCITHMKEVLKMKCAIKK